MVVFPNHNMAISTGVALMMKMKVFFPRALNQDLAMLGSPRDHCQQKQS